ncbi:hypothetical protein BZG36_02865 [Bifiguratus adelaidae]|uniref:Sugar phosphate transporter domain-containing protein n=1 Tax=Bifiguratus adelaidae TaxID=1938954 RepID=A0A261Y0M2_9FUNG|nr:hypothetical protein BZG36_02865 [Bifiguratus adelaidae]
MAEGAAMTDMPSAHPPHAPSLRAEKPVSIRIHHPDQPLPNLKSTSSSITQNVVYILAWYFFSTSLSLYNKNLMGKDRFNLHFPLMLSAMHTGLHAVLTTLMMLFGKEHWRGSTSQGISLYNYVFKVVPCGIAAALEICFANASLIYITLTFYTMVKSSTPIFVLVFSFLFGLERPKSKLILIISVMVIGVILTVRGETQFDLFGFVLVGLATVISGLRWTMTQILLQADRLGMNNPVATLFYLSPVMFVTMLILSLSLEDVFTQIRTSEHFATLQLSLETIGLMWIGGLLAFAMTLAEFYLIKNTNTVTLSVAGVSKEIVVIALSVMIYGDELTGVNLLGLVVSISGILAYNYYKFSKSSRGHYRSLSRGSQKVLDV